MNKLKIVAASVGGVFVVAHIGLLGYVIHRPKQPQVPMINIPHGDYSSYSIRAGKDGYEIQYRANDPAILESHKSLDLQKSQLSIVETEKSTEVIEAKAIAEEFGVIDYQEMIEDYMNESTESLQRITGATTWIGEQLDKKTSEMNAMTLNGNQPGRKTLKDFFVRTAKIMDNFANTAHLNPCCLILQNITFCFYDKKWSLK